MKPNKVSSPGLKPLKGKSVAPKTLPKQTTNKSPSQFVYNKKGKVSKNSKPKKGLVMLGKAMSKFKK